MQITTLGIPSVNLINYNCRKMKSFNFLSMTTRNSKEIKTNYKKYNLISYTLITDSSKINLSPK